MIDRALAGMFKVVTDEAVNNPAFGKKLEESLAKFGQKHDIQRLPFSMKIVLENLLRFEDGTNVTVKEVEAVANWQAKAEPDTEISFMPARVVLQDFTGVPCVVDLAALVGSAHHRLRDASCYIFRENERGLRRAHRDLGDDAAFR